MRRPLALVVMLALMPGPASAQSLTERFTELFTFGDCGEPLCLSVDVAGQHGQHYIPSVTQGESDLLAFVTGSIAMSLSNLPFTAATGGVMFQFVDGLPVATSVSTGGVFGERSQTLGRGRLLVGAYVNSLSMDRIRGVPMRDLTFRFTHENVGNPAMGSPAFENDVIEVRSRVELDLLVTSVLASFGVHDNVDVGVLLPIVRASLSGTSEAQVVPFQHPTPHLFGTADNPSEFADAESSGSAVGIGDIALRVKANLHQSADLGVGLAGDVRLPTGDSGNFLGGGQTSVRALGIVSARIGDFSPHLNGGVVFRSGERQNHSLVGTLGFDHLLDARVTLAVDFLGDFELGDSRLQLPDRVVFDEPTRRRIRLTDIPDQRDHTVDASVGLKVQFLGDYRVVTNVLAPLSDGGLRPRYLWTAGVERMF